VASQVIPLEEILTAPVANPPWTAEQAAAVAFDPDPEMVMEWDYDRRLLTQWIRKGECNGCGDCCTAEIVVATTQGQGNWYGPGTSGHGKWYGAQGGGRSYFARTVKVGQPGEAPCPALSPECRCTIYDRRPTLCHAWPMGPDHLKALPRCSYTFERGRTWALEADWKIGEEVPAIEFVEADGEERK
jgi:Fe-S-cluster containining protein